MIKLERCPPSSRFDVAAIDMCMGGWIEGVTRPKGKPAAETDGDGAFGILERYAAKQNAEVVRIDRETLREFMATPSDRRPVRIRHLDGTHGWPHATYEGMNAGYDLWEICRAQLARDMNDARASQSAWAWKDKIADHLATLYRSAACIIAGLEETLAATWLRESARPLDRKGLPILRGAGTAPPLFLEGGHGLAERCAAAVAIQHDFPVCALERCWYPEHFLASWDSGQCGNRWYGTTFRNRHVRESEGFIDTILEDLRRAGWPEPLARSGGVKLILGQVPWDASLALDAGVMPEELLRYVCGEAAPICFRPHPDEGDAVSLLDGTSSVQRFLEEADRRGNRDVSVSPAGRTLWEDLGDASQVYAVTSQAGWQAALWRTVYVYGRPFYADSNVAHSTGLGAKLRRVLWLEETARLLEYYWPIEHDLFVFRHLLRKGVR